MTLASTVRRQGLISRSTAEAETVAAHDMVKLLDLFREIYCFIGYEDVSPATLFTDSESVLYITDAHAGALSKSKFFKMRVNDTREYILRGFLRVRFIGTHDIAI